MAVCYQIAASHKSKTTIQQWIYKAVTKIRLMHPWIALITIRPKGRRYLPLELFALYATGQYSMPEATMKVREWGLIYCKSGTKVPASTLNAILCKRLYSGEFTWNGKLFQGSHGTIVSFELWDRVQAVMGGPASKETPSHDS
jgi:hypothetical protein